MNSLYEAMTTLSPIDDVEMLEGYRRYVSVLEPILTPEQMQTYAELIRRTGEIRIFEELTIEESTGMSPQERELAAAVVADIDASMENRRVVALLNQRGEHEIAPDLGSPVMSSS